MALTNTAPATYPASDHGKVVRRWFAEGMKAGLEDIAAIVDNGDSAIDRLNAIREWIENNSGVSFQ